MLARQGVDLIPFERIRTWAGNIDIRTVILENTAFKYILSPCFPCLMIVIKGDYADGDRLSFGTAFIMAAWYT